MQYTSIVSISPVADKPAGKRFVGGLRRRRRSPFRLPAPKTQPPVHERKADLSRLPDMRHAACGGHSIWKHGLRMDLFTVRNLMIQAPRPHHTLGVVSRWAQRQ